jgi:caffeoyl-CoA O-methyltransferase
MIGLSAELHQYVIDHSGGPDEVSSALATATRERFGDLAMMNIGEDQGRLLAMLVGLCGARTAVEVGTFTGMSALWIARGLPPGGRLVCLDVSEEFVGVGRPFWELADVADRIEVRIAPAADSLASMPAEPHIDFAFVDADKDGYRTYVELLLPRLNPGGVIAVDNVLWSGSVIDDDDQSANTVAIRAFNDWVRDDPALEAAMIGIGDGLTLIRRCT